MLILTATSCLLLIMLPVPSATSADREINFSRDILPLLSENCFACHGPDGAHRDSDLRLDSLEAATAKPDSGNAAIVPGHSDQSELIKRISATDNDLKMPPPGSEKSLTPAQIDLIKRWIDGGAIWTGHWAFQPPTKPTVADSVEGWTANNPIDAFIHANLKLAGLSPEHRATKEALIRRATLDLTGLPATIDDIDRFLADESLEAFEHVIDRLLRSQQYGEHMARIWLDAARYGDTH